MEQAVFPLARMTTKFVGIWPLAKRFGFGNREAMCTTLPMSTDLTFGST